MRVLISPNAFKNAIDAAEAAKAIQFGLEQSRLNCTCECFPIGDGGDGTGELIIQRCSGQLTHSENRDPLGKKISGSFGLIDDNKTAIIEMANASGLRLLQRFELDPLRATSFGTGEQILAALDHGATRIIIAMGGSATVDGATGMLQALGYRFMNGHGEEITELPAKLTELSSIDITAVDARLRDTEVVVLCDVDNLLLGDKGAAAMFGPQKGASADAVKHLDRSLERFAEVAFNLTGRDMRTIKYGGTAGGAAAGLYALLNAQLVNGIEYFLDLTHFEEALQDADLVITGEGSIDEQTLQGKGPFGVAARAKAKGIPVIGLAGRVPADVHEGLSEYFDALVAIGHQPQRLEDALQATSANLTRTSFSIGNILAFPK